MKKLIETGVAALALMFAGPLAVTAEEAEKAPYEISSAGLGHHPMAGDHQSGPIIGASGAHGPGRFGLTDTLCQLGVGHGLAFGDFSQSLPNLGLKGGGPHIDRQ